MLPTDFNASINDKSGVRDPFGGGMSGFSKRHGSKVKIVEIFSMDRDGEIAAFEAHSAKGNRTLLWHGTNIAVAAAICSSGMRIMPNSGGRVGQGIYLANQSVKSGHYVQPAQDGTGIMFLEVLLTEGGYFFSRHSSMGPGRDLRLRVVLGHDA